MSSASRLLPRVATAAALLFLATTTATAQTQTRQGKPGERVRVPVNPEVAKGIPSTIKIPGNFEGLFNLRDDRAESVLGYLKCVRATLAAQRAGTLGPIPAEWTLTCVRQGEEWRGVFTEAFDGGRFVAVKMQYAMRANGGSGALVRTPVDTAVVVATARALARGFSVPRPGTLVEEFVPIPLHQGSFVEVWFLSVPSNPARVTVGGDSLIQMERDGSRELGHMSKSPAKRVLSLPTSGKEFVLESSEEQLPLLSELVTARMAAELVPTVRVLTKRFESTWVRSQGAWTHRSR